MGENCGGVGEKGLEKEAGLDGEVIISTAKR